MSRALPAETDPSAVKHLLSMSGRRADGEPGANSRRVTVKHPKQHQEEQTPHHYHEKSPFHKYATMRSRLGAFVEAQSDATAAKNRQTPDGGSGFIQ